MLFLFFSNSTLIKRKAEEVYKSCFQKKEKGENFFGGKGFLTLSFEIISPPSIQVFYFPSKEKVWDIIYHNAL
jgi:hypothetical protein